MWSFTAGGWLPRQPVAASAAGYLSPWDAAARRSGARAFDELVRLVRQGCGAAGVGDARRGRRSRLELRRSAHLPGAVAEAGRHFVRYASAERPDDRLADSSCRRYPVPSKVEERRCAVYLLVCLILGGSAQGIWQNAVLQLTGLAIIGWAAATRSDEPVPAAAKAFLLLVMAAVAVVALQAVPVPAGIWAHGIRGRIADGYQLLGRSPALPLSVTPYASSAALLGLIPPLAIFCAIVRVQGIPRELAGGCAACGHNRGDHPLCLAGGRRRRFALVPVRQKRMPASASAFSQTPITWPTCW